MIAQSSENSALSERRKRSLKKKLDKSLAALRHDRNNHQLHIEVGDFYAQLDQLAQADHHYSAAIDLLQQGTIDEKIRKQIIMLYGKILSVAPEKTMAYLSLAQEYDSAGQKEKAVRFLLSSGKRAFDQANYALALACYQQVIAMGRGNPYLMERCTEIYLKLGQKEQAMVKYIEIGDLYAREEKYIDALDYYKKANAVGAESPELILKIARMYYAMEWKENAAAELVKLAEYYERKGNVEEAVKFYQHSSNLDQYNQKAREGKFRLMYQHADTPQSAAMAASVASVSAISNADVLGELDQLEDRLTVLNADEEEAGDELSELIDLTFHNDSPKSSLSEMPPIFDETHKIDASVLLDTNSLPLPVFELEADDDDSEPAGTGDMVMELEYDDENISSENQQTQIASAPMLWDDRLMDLELGQQQPSQGTQIANRKDEEEIDLFFEEEDASTREEETFSLPDKSELERTPDESDRFEWSFEEPAATLEETPEVVDVLSEQGDMRSEAVAPSISDTSRSDLEEAAEALVRQVMEMDVPQEEEAPSQPQEHHATPQTEEMAMFEGDAAELYQKFQALEKHLQNTEEEKYFLQEQFAAQIGDLKTKETLIQRQYETAQKERNALQLRLDQMLASYEVSRQKADQFDDARYEAMIRKIQQKKDLLQQHVNLLLREREQNGHFLQEELKQLSAAKERLQQNVASIQQAKKRVEFRINTELRQAQEQIRTLSATSFELQQQLQTKLEAERELREHEEKLRNEKEALQDQFTETIAALTSENESLERQLYELTTHKSQAERALKKKLHTIYHAHQRLKSRFQHILAAKEQELSRTAQQLSEFADEYVKLESGLNAIRSERDKLDAMLVKETATREHLQEKLVGLEQHINSLEEQGTGLLEQLEEELNRQLATKQSTADEFQESLEELEQLLARQEEEIHALELV